MSVHVPNLPPPTHAYPFLLLQYTGEAGGAGVQEGKVTWPF